MRILSVGIVRASEDSCNNAVALRVVQFGNSLPKIEGRVVRVLRCVLEVIQKTAVSLPTPPRGRVVRREHVEVEVAPRTQVVSLLSNALK